jgi:acyl carrier protein
MPESIQERVLRVIATTKRVPLESVKPDSSFESLGIDSLDRLNILFDLESEFDIEIDDDDARQVSSIPQMVEGVTLLVNAKEAGLPAPHFPRAAAAPAEQHAGEQPGTTSLHPGAAFPEKDQ